MDSFKLDYSRLFLFIVFLLINLGINSHADQVVRLEHKGYSSPRSILVLPPINESEEPDATYSVLSSVTRPLVNAGYYVFPVAIVDAFLKQNGLPTPYEMHAARIDKTYEVLGAEAILYLRIEKYGQYYNVIDSKTQVEVKGKMVDTRSGEVLWEGKAKEHKSASYGNKDIFENLIAAFVNQVVHSSYDSARKLTYKVNHRLYEGYSFPKGPFYLEHQKETK